MAQLDAEQIDYINYLLLQNPSDDKKSLIMDFIQQTVQGLASAPMAPTMKNLLNQAAAQVASSELVEILKPNLLQQNLYLLVANYLIDVEDVTADVMNTKSLLASQLPTGVFNKFKRTFGIRTQAPSSSANVQTEVKNLN